MISVSKTLWSKITYLSTLPALSFLFLTIYIFFQFLSLCFRRTQGKDLPINSVLISILCFNMSFMSAEVSVCFLLSGKLSSSLIKIHYLLLRWRGWEIAGWLLPSCLINPWRTNNIPFARRFFLSFRSWGNTVTSVILFDLRFVASSYQHEVVEHSLFIAVTHILNKDILSYTLRPALAWQLPKF